jgi:CheY-like chemotaxis protein
MTGSGKRALVVDDNLINLEVAATLLRREGWTVATLDNGAEALQWLAREPVEVVLLDLSMPGLSGEEVCHRLRSRAESRGLYIVAYTAHALEHERERILECGFDDILVKPISRERLLEVVAARDGLAE